nr:reverse transcriptase domain-containing protein [Tanacetum cinerariifolium]
IQESFKIFWKGSKVGYGFDFVLSLDGIDRLTLKRFRSVNVALLDRLQDGWFSSVDIRYFRSVTIELGLDRLNVDIALDRLRQIGYNRVGFRSVDCGYSIRSVEAEVFLNDDPPLPPPTQGNYLPEVRKELKICKAKCDKSSIDEPPEVELKDLLPHLEYAFLEGDDKFPIIIAKDLSLEEKNALITVLKSRKRAIA